MNRIFVKTVCIALAAAMVLSLAGCDELRRSAFGDEEQSVVIVGEGTGQELADTYKADDKFSLNSVEGESFNPFLSGSAWNMMAGMLAYEPLVKTDSTFEAQPNLVTGWDSQDGINWTFYVDTDRMLHNDTPLTANDVTYSLIQARDYYGSRFAKRFSHVQNISVLDANSFTVTLDQANWRFYELMTIPCIAYGTGYMSAPPGTGPYEFNSKQTALTLDEDYPTASQFTLKKIYLKHYATSEEILQAFEDSLLDMVINNPADMSSLGYSSSNLIKYVDTTNMHFLGYNAQSRLFSQSNYRALVTYAIDRENIVSNAMQGSGVAATLPIHPNSTLYPKELADSLAFSPESLKTALEMVGAVDVDYDGVLEYGGSKQEIVFIVCSDSAAKVTAARQIANQLRSMGMTIAMRELNEADYDEAMAEGTYDIYYAEVKLCNDWDFSPMIAADSDLNAGKIQDSALLNNIQTFLASDANALPANTQTLCEYFAQSAPFTPICFEKSQVLYHRGVLGTITPTQDNVFNDMQDWTVTMD